MSYILDALKKSEQERKKGTVPGLGTIQGLPGGRLGDNWPLRYYLAGTLILLVATAVFAWLFLREPAPSNPQIATPPPAVAPTAPLVAPAEKSPAQAEVLPRSEKSPPSAGAPQRQRTLTPAATKDTTHKAPARATTMVPTRPGLSPFKTAVPANTPAPATMQPETITKASSPLPPQTLESPPEPPPPDIPSEEAEVVVKPEEMPIVPLAELPDEIKSEIPEVKIGIHFFSDDPASRRAGVNGRLLHEGQQVEKELTLKEITKDGAILAFRGRRFSLAVFPR